MNAYQGGGTSQGKLIPIKRHFAGLISELFLRWSVPASLISIHMRFQSSNWYIYEKTCII